MIAILIILAVALVVCEIPEWIEHNRRLDERIEHALAATDFDLWEQDR